MANLHLLPIFILIFMLYFLSTRPVSAVSWWEFQSIDTMKYSRDLAREKLKDPAFDRTIDDMVSRIAATGATHIAIATPYDEEFVPFLTRWVNAARKYHLHIWFRGNFSGWENWFEYPRIDRQQHLNQTKDFLNAHSDLITSGDVYTACPECENGGPGDPRMTGDISGFRQFLIDEHTLMSGIFKNLNKDVRINFNSMNGDVAKIIMDKNTTAALGGIVAIDHYVTTPEQLITDVNDIATKSGGKVILGEWGAPIPDIHGNMTSEQQKEWINKALDGMSVTDSLLGLNYWTSTGSSTEIWSSSLQPRTAVAVLTKYYSPKTLSGKVVTPGRRPIAGATVRTQNRTAVTNKDGTYELPVLNTSETVTINHPKYILVQMPVDVLDRNKTVSLEPITSGFYQMLLDFFHRLGQRLRLPFLR
jgi:hypothetical protein